MESNLDLWGYTSEVILLCKVSDLFMLRKPISNFFYFSCTNEHGEVYVFGGFNGYEDDRYYVEGINNNLFR